MATYISHSPQETEQFACEYARQLEAGCVIGLQGDLGAGKTQFVKGLARGLASSERVHSPTFTLINIYTTGRLPLYHLDLYRLENQADILRSGLEEYFQPDGITVVEWIDRWQGPLPDKFQKIELQVLDEFDREIIYDHPGS
jgi:tRNA threonylcarbamoyladenosine biosynthesis protein TsaE